MPRGIYKRNEGHNQNISKALKGHKTSEETKRKIGKANKGRIPWIKGKKRSKETRKKLSEIHKRLKLPIPSHKGRRHSMEAKRKISEANLGKKRTEKTKKKISEALKGRKFSEERKKKLRGRKHSEDTKKKMSEARKGCKASEETRQKLRESHKGKKASEETRKRMSRVRKGKKHSEEAKRKMSKNSARHWLGKTGEETPRWKGGITPENRKIRTSIEFRLWRESVFARDNWTCQKCKVRGSKLHSHHIQNFAQFPELRFAINNGIAFCRCCHTEFHKIYGIRNNTREQVEEFLEIRL